MQKQLDKFPILGLLFLLLDPWVSWTRNETNPQNISVILDLSESMFAHMDDYGIKFDEIKRNIQQWASRHELNLLFFKLGQRITILDNMTSRDITTDFRAIPNFISFEQPQQVLLITDGKATVGKNINEIKFNSLTPINTLGVGPDQIKQVIEIQDIILPELLVQGDTVNLKIRIASHLRQNVQTDFQIINKLGNQNGKYKD